MINYRVPHHVHIVYIKGRKPLHLRKGVISILQVAIVQVKTLRMLTATTVMLLESVLLKKMRFKIEKKIEKNDTRWLPEFIVTSWRTTLQM